MELNEATIHNSTLGRSYPLWTAGAAQSGAAHLCLFLDGQFYLQRMPTLQTLEQLQREGAIPAVRAVFVSHLDAAARHRDFACNPEYARFLANEVIPHISAEFIPAPLSTTLIGLSLSGLAAAFTVLQHPGVVAQAICQSPSAWYEDEWLRRHVRDLDVTGCRFWISVGSEETDAGVSHEPSGMYQGASQLESCRQLARSLTEHGAATHFEMFVGGHAFGSWHDDLAAALRWALAG